MKQSAAAKISGIGSILAGLTFLFFYSREMLPLTDAHVAKNEFPYYLVSLAAAVAGIFLLAAGWKKKKLALLIGAAALFLGIPLLFYAVPRAPWEYAPRRLAMVGRGLIPAAFLLLGIFAIKGYQWASGVLCAAFSALGLYHAVLTVKLIARSGAAFSGMRTGDIAIALAIAVVSLFFAWTSLKALRHEA
jgi:hypothetical protein